MILLPRLLSFLPLIAVLAACESVPDFGPPPGGAAEDVGEPQILPLRAVLAEAQSVTISAADTSSLEGRAEALRRRAAALRETQIE